MSTASSCVRCGEGTYQSGSGMISQIDCLRCGAGKFQTGSGLISETDCSACGQGKFQTGFGMPTELSCTLCSPGTFQTGLGMVIASNCSLCGAGTYQTGSGMKAASNCGACGAGKYQTGSGMFEEARCVLCSAGKYQTGLSAVDGSTCLSCGRGTFGTGSGMVSLTNCSLCASGTYQTGTGMIGVATCTACGAGKYQTGEGFINESDCQLCIKGTYSTISGRTSSSDCTLCPQGTFQTGSGLQSLSGCTLCRSGTYQTGFGKQSPSDCSKCGAGTFQTGFGIVTPDRCSQCSAGTYSTVEEAAGCSTCESGKYQTGQGMIYAVNCTLCPFDTYGTKLGATSTQDCTPCPARTGTLNETGKNSSLSCVCRSQYYQLNGIDASICLNCPIGALCDINQQKDTCAFNTAPSIKCKQENIKGNWTKNNAGKYVLINCPSGTSLRSISKTGSEDAQECMVCRTNQYILHPNVDDCQDCPPGLICHGNSKVEARQEGSFWNADGSIYRLTSCPTGYEIFKGYRGVFNASLQDCVPCDKGFECALSNCSVCTPCKNGTYKETRSSSLCQPCDANTFNVHVGSISRSDCAPCPCLSTTQGRTGQYRQDACVCEAQYYKAISNSSASCQTCPRGAVCASSECALANFPSFNCPGKGSVIGTWMLNNETGRYLLVACPPGSSLRSALKTGSSDLQECQPCLNPGQYIISPSSDDCQTCPPGLICSGTENVEPRIKDSEWVQNGSIFRLTSCPSGYETAVTSLSGLFDAANQQCSPCKAGEECTARKCTSCSLCKPGFYKPDASPSNCLPCPENTYSPSEGATSITSCNACPSHASTSKATGRSNFSACTCDDGWYMDTFSSPPVCVLCPDGAICVEGLAPMFGTAVKFEITLGDVSTASFCCDLKLQSVILQSLAQSLGIEISSLALDSPCATIQCTGARRELGGLQIQITAVVSASQASKTLASLSSSSFLEAFSAASNLSAVVAVLTNPNATSASSAGQVYGPADEQGRYHLLWCNPGYLLVNDSLSTQACIACGPGTYSFNPLDGCGEVCSIARSCNKCPIGASCSGLSNFNPLLSKSKWIMDYDRSTKRNIMRLVSCPPGHSLVNATDGTSSGEFSPDAQQCIACNAGKYIVNPNSDSCQACPRGALCPDGMQFVPLVNGSIWRAEMSSKGQYLMRLVQCPVGYVFGRDDQFPDQDRCIICEKDTYSLVVTNSTSQRCLNCPIGANCPGGDVVNAIPGYWRLLAESQAETMTESAKVFRCPPGYCLGGNRCNNNGTGPVCGICHQIAVMTTQGCKQCPDEEQIAPLRNAAIAIFSIFACIIWVGYSWSPFIPAIERQTQRCFASRSEATSTPSNSVFQRFMFLYTRGAQIADEIKLTQYFKILISFFQVVSSFTSMQTEWPAFVLGGMMWMKATINFSFLSLPGLSCLWKTISYRSKLMTYTLVPLGFGIALALPWFIGAFTLKHSKDSDARRRYEVIVDRFWNGILLVAFLVYPMLSLITLQPFDCQPYGLGLLAADYRETCPESAGFERVWAAIFIVLFPVGIPVGSILALRGMGVHMLSAKKVEIGLVSALVNLFIKQTTTVESQRIAQLVGSIKEGEREEFKARALKVYRAIKPRGPNEETAASDKSRSAYQIAETDILGTDVEEIWKFIQLYDTDGDGNIDADEFLNMARAVSKVIHIFTGAETGRIEELDESQLNTLIIHDWSTKAQDETDNRSVIRCIQKQQVDISTGFASLSEEDKSIIHLSNEQINIIDKDIESKRRWVIAKAASLRKSGLLSIPRLEWRISTSTKPEVATADKGDGETFDDDSEHPTEERPSAEEVKVQDDSVKDRSAAKIVEDLQLMEDKAIMRAGFIFTAYDVEFWYWESIEMFRKFLMTSVLVTLMYPGEPIQVAAGVLLTFIFFGLNTTCKPFCSDGLDHYYNVTLSAEFIVLFGGLVLVLQVLLRSEGSTTDLTTQTGIIEAIIYAANIAVFAWPVIQFFVFEDVTESIRYLRCEGKEEDAGPLVRMAPGDSADADAFEGVRAEEEEEVEGDPGRPAKAVDADPSEFPVGAAPTGRAADGSDARPAAPDQPPRRRPSREAAAPPAGDPSLQRPGHHAADGTPLVTPDGQPLRLSSLPSAVHAPTPGDGWPAAEAAPRPRAAVADAGMQTESAWWLHAADTPLWPRFAASGPVGGASLSAEVGIPQPAMLEPRDVTIRGLGKGNRSDDDEVGWDSEQQLGVLLAPAAGIRSLGDAISEQARVCSNLVFCGQHLPELRADGGGPGQADGADGGAAPGT